MVDRRGGPQPVLTPGKGFSGRVCRRGGRGRRAACEAGLTVPQGQSAETLGRFSILAALRGGWWPIPEPQHRAVRTVPFLTDDIPSTPAPHDAVARGDSTRRPAARSHGRRRRRDHLRRRGRDQSGPGGATQQGSRRGARRRPAARTRRRPPPVPPRSRRLPTAGLGRGRSSSPPPSRRRRLRPLPPPGRSTSPPRRCRPPPGPGRRRVRPRPGPPRSRPRRTRTTTKPGSGGAERTAAGQSAWRPVGRVARVRRSAGS